MQNTQQAEVEISDSIQAGSVTNGAPTVDSPPARHYRHFVVVLAFRPRLLSARME